MSQGHIPDFKNEDKVSIGISLTFEVTALTYRKYQGAAALR